MIIACCGAATHAGYVRSLNEDNYCCDIKHGLWVVADGVGGHEGGEVASKIAIESLLRNVHFGLNITQAVEKAHQDIIEAPNYGVGSAGMGTTVAAVKVTNENYDIAWVGDSRVYLLRNGNLCRLTTDHSYAQKLLDKGEITTDEAFTHPSRHILTRCLGMKSDNYVVKPGYCHRNLYEGDRLLLCTDGLYGELSEQEILGQFGTNKNDQDVADILISKALKKGGRDNITAIVLSMMGD